MQTLKYGLVAMLFVASVGGVALTLIVPQSVAAAGTCSDQLLTFPAWFKGLTDGSCNIVNPNDVGGIGPFIWTIALNIIEFILQLVGYISVGFIIYGGFKYMISTGIPDGIAKGKKIITNAVIGLLISIFSVAIVQLVAGAIR